jgi:hypothetical protein
MEDDEEERIGVRWFARETLFLIVGMVLWGAFGWRVLWGVIPVVLVVNLLWFIRSRSVQGE